MAALNSLLQDLKYALTDNMSKGFIFTIFVNFCIVFCFGIVGDIVLCVCCPGTKNYSLLGCPLSGFDILCIVVVEIGDLTYVLMIPLLYGFSLGNHPLKAKWWEDYLLHIRSEALFANYFSSFPSYYSWRNLHALAALLTPSPRTEDFSY